MKSIPDFLRELPGVFTANRAPSATRASLPFTGVAGGIPEGAITEISGPPGGGKTEVLLKFLSENPDTRVAWIEERFTAYPCAFVQSGVRLERVLFVEASPSEGMWAVLQCLRSQAFEIVVYFGAAAADERALRRLQLAAERSGVALILLAEEPARKGTWPIAVQVHVVRTNLSPTTTLLKSKAVGTSSGAGRRDLGEQPIDSCERAVALATDIKGAL